ncbi:MAG: DUF3306 domain-containing protein [Pseudolabrys sp.]
MNDPDNFLSRWSRRKREAGAQSGREASAPPERNDRGEAVTPPCGDDKSPDTPGSVPPASSVPDLDVSSLPPIEAIGADTDISAFLQKGVPSALRHAALRRVWSADPAIRDFVGPNENFWDAAGPDGIPGFGALDPNLDVKRMVSELFGEIEPAKAKPETSEFTDASGPPAEISETPSLSDDRPSQQNENAAPQQQMSEPGPGKKITRRHGGAMPE